MPITRYSPTIFSRSVKSGSRGTLSSVGMGSATWPFREGRECSPASHRASLRLGAMASKAPAIASDRMARGFRPVRRTRSPAVT